jgi:hypothetical protein
MKFSKGFGAVAICASLIAMGAQCGGEPVTQCEDSEGRIVACPDSDVGNIVVHHDAGPRPDAGSADTGRNLPFEAECNAGEQGGCRFACLDTPQDWAGEGSGGFCTKPCTNHGDCGESNHWRCEEVNAEYLCVRDHDSSAPTAQWVGANASRSLFGSGLTALEFEAHDDRALGEVSFDVAGNSVDVTAAAPVVNDNGVTRRYSVSVPSSSDDQQVTATIRDSIGQSVEIERVLSYDSTGPSVELVEDQNLRAGGCVPSPSSVAVVATDNQALIHVRIVVDSTVVATILPDGSATRIDTGTMIDYRAAGISSGLHTLKAIAEDSAGNTSEDSIRLRIMTDRSSGNPCD